MIRGITWRNNRFDMFIIIPCACPYVDRIVSALYLQQYSSDPFHICASYQATSEGVLRVKFVSNFKKNEILANSLNLQLWLSFFFTWDPVWINSMGNHEAAGVSSERRRSSCSSLVLCTGMINAPMHVIRVGHEVVMVSIVAMRVSVMHITLRHPWYALTSPCHHDGCRCPGVYSSHWGRVLYARKSKVNHHCFRLWLVACTAPSHYLR